MEEVGEQRKGNFEDLVGGDVDGNGGREGKELEDSEEEGRERNWKIARRVGGKGTER